MAMTCEQKQKIDQVVVLLAQALCLSCLKNLSKEQREQIAPELRALWETLEALSRAAIDESGLIDDCDASDFVTDAEMQEKIEQRGECGDTVKP